MDSEFKIESPYPRVILFKDILDAYKCNEIIARFEKSILKHPGKLGNPPVLKKEIKHTTDLPLSEPEFEDIDQLIYSLIQPYLSKYLEIMDGHFSMYMKDDFCIKDTGYHIQKYEPNGYYREHHDFYADLENGLVRIATFILYLNTLDSNKGGRTLFSYPVNCAVQPIQGSCLFFPATWDFLHQGEECLTNKYIITGWFSLARAENTTPEKSTT
jgi:hypothetical protein